MTTASPIPSYSAIKGAGEIGDATVELHHGRGHDLKDLAGARGRLEDLVELTAARAAQLHSLRRYEEANVRHVRLVSPGTAKETPLERRFNNRKISVAEAVELVVSKGEQIRRSTFSAVIVAGEQSV
ncbi:hypothetical protein Sa4125_11780 [Aureimonas sp. SA4125]|uniref:hypothetical protein n=1 Tax=Aureimonas sp. SA4125 TaxID=2826993 RepID=UPI001CC4402A|nr:hypothetical protein [Aureimonas sp. SA4125]BDA83636.1 hypothetical protein Sa4125_11780 [Aureimonas sp. SA4125]